MCRHIRLCWVQTNFKKLCNDAQLFHHLFSQFVKEGASRNVFPERFCMQCIEYALTTICLLAPHWSPGHYMQVCKNNMHSSRERWTLELSLLPGGPNLIELQNTPAAGAAPIKHTFLIATAVTWTCALHLWPADPQAVHQVVDDCCWLFNSTIPNKIYFNWIPWRRVSRR